MVKKMELYKVRGREQTREDFKNGVVPCRVAYEKFVNQRFEEEEYTMSKKLVLGLEYMDSVEYFLYFMRLTKDFSKLSTAHGLLINGSRDYQSFTSDDTPKWHNDSDCDGQPINHDRFWIIKQLCVGHIDEATLIAKINDFGERANHLINYIGSILEQDASDL